MSDQRRYSWDLPIGTTARLWAENEEAQALSMSRDQYVRLGVDERRRLLVGTTDAAETLRQLGVPLPTRAEEPLSEGTQRVLRGEPEPPEREPSLSDDLLERGYIEGWALAITFATEEEFRAGRWGWAIAYLVLSLMIQAVVIYWRGIKRALGPRFAATANASVHDFRFWIGTLAIFLMTVTFSPFVEQQRWPFSREAINQASPVQMCWGGPCPTYEGSPLGWAWDQYNVNIQLQGTPTAAPLILSFGVLGKNVGAEEVNLKDAYMVSEIDGTKLPLKIRVDPNDLIDITEAGPVPPNAPFSLVAAFNPGIPEADFLRAWGTLSVVISYEGGKVRHTYSRELIRSQIDEQNPYTRPHVTRRKP